jgi:pyridoxamine 5'-phosphate oxidase
MSAIAGAPGGERPDMPPLDLVDLVEDPIEQFQRWYREADVVVPLAEACCLATVDPHDGADARMVLLRGFDPHGFRFHSNYGSAKAGQLAAEPRAALVFYWRELDRQVRVRGTVERLPAPESDRYFASRPRERQLAAWASPQSRPLRDRTELDARLAEVEARFKSGEVPRPDGWGGYLLRPDEIEFWQGQAHRLHDRFRYRRDGGGWVIERLAP